MPLHCAGPTSGWRWDAPAPTSLGSAADLVLLDDSFAHIVEAVEEGRAAFDNVRRFLTYHLTDNVAELTPFVIWALSAGRIPLMISVLQVLALDIGTDLLPGGGARRRTARARRDGSGAEVEGRARSSSRHVLARAFGFLGPVEAAMSMADGPHRSRALLRLVHAGRRCPPPASSRRRSPRWCSPRSC